MLTSYKLWKSICLRNYLATFWKAQIVLVDGNILLTKIKFKCPIGQNLVRKHEFQISYKLIDFFKKTMIFLFLKRVLLLVITSPHLIIIQLCLPRHIHLSTHSFQESCHDHKKFWSFHQILPPPSPIAQVGGDDAMRVFCLELDGDASSTPMFVK